MLGSVMCTIRKDRKLNEENTFRLLFLVRCKVSCGLLLFLAAVSS